MVAFILYFHLGPSLERASMFSFSEVFLLVCGEQLISLVLICLVFYLIIYVILSVFSMMANIPKVLLK